MRVYRAWAIVLITLEFMWVCFWFGTFAYFISQHTGGNTKDLYYFALMGILVLRLVQGAVLGIVEHHRNGMQKMDRCTQYTWIVTLSYPVLIDIVAVLYTILVLGNPPAGIDDYYLYQWILALAISGLVISLMMFVWFIMAANYGPCAMEWRGKGDDSDEKYRSIPQPTMSSKRQPSWQFR